MSLLFALALLTAGGGDLDRAEILRDIDVVDRRGVPGTVLVFGDRAFAVLTANDPPEAVVAAARFGKGRVVAIAHNGYLSADTIGQTGSGAARLFGNALRWAAGTEKALTVGVIGRDRRLIERLRARGHDARPCDPGKNDGLDVLVWKGDIDPGHHDAIRTFVAEGGGLICAVCPWGYEQVNAKRGLTLRRHLGENRVLGPMGLVFARGYANATGGGGFVVSLSRPEGVHAGRAFADLLAHERGDLRLDLVEKAIANLPPDDTILLPRLVRTLGSLADGDAPRPDRPLGGDRAIARLRISWYTQSWKTRPVEKVAKAPGADEFPGRVPDDAVRVTRKLELHPGVRGWQGVGLYLAAGEVLEIRAGETTGWSVRIGGHADRLWGKKVWRRWPEITHRVDVGRGLTRVATPFGGTIYFEADRAGRAPLRAEVSGAVEAPRYVLADPDRARRWKKARRAPGPWTELEGRHLVLSVPSAVVRAWRDPEPLLEWWDGVVESHCKLAATAVPERRERFVPDVQISAGYMHSGYPIMCHLDMVTSKGGALPRVLDLETLSTRGNWGFLHELGHNRQRRAWTFAGTGEVTCNLFSLYSSQTMAGIEPWSNPWLERQKKAGRAHLAKGAPFEEWKKKPGVALLMYAQMQRAFGWEPFIRVFAEYEDLRPGSEQEKIDQWLTRMSKAVGRDLRPFFRKWGLPVNESVMVDRSLDALKVWMPDFGER